jgi:hypothetical protein
MIVWLLQNIKLYEKNTQKTVKQAILVVLRISPESFEHAIQQKLHVIKGDFF